MNASGGDGDETDSSADDGDIVPSLTRRNTLQALAVGSVGAGSLLGGATVSADEWSVPPVGALPGESYHENAYYTRYDSDGGEPTVLDRVDFVNASRGIRLTNFRLLQEDDMIGHPCSDTDESGKTSGIEFRFVVSGFSQGYALAWQPDDPDADVSDGDGEFEFVSSWMNDLLGETDSVVDITYDDGMCGSYSLRPHYSNAESVPREFDSLYQEVSSAPQSGREFAEALEESGVYDGAVDAYDRYSDDYRTFFGLFTWMTSNAREFDLIDLESFPDGSGLLFGGIRIGSELNGIVSAYQDVRTLIDYFHQDESERQIWSYGGTSFEFGADGGPEVRYLCDFTVTVPADLNETVTVPVKTTFNYRNPPAWNVEPDLTNTAVFEIEIPKNEGLAVGSGVDVTDIALPTISLKEDDSSGHAIRVDDSNPAPGQAVTFAPGQSLLRRLNSARPTDITWVIKNEETDERSPTHTFSTPGEYEAILKIEQVPTGNGSTDEEVHRLLYSRTIAVGDGYHVAPHVEIEQSPRPAYEGDSVELLAVVSNATGSLTYDWSITPVDRSTLQRGETIEYTGDSATIDDVRSGYSYDVEVIVEDDSQRASATTTVTTRAGITATIDVDHRQGSNNPMRVQLDATDSWTEDGRIDSYTWTIRSAPDDATGETGIIAAGPTEATTTYTFGSLGEYLLELVVDHEDGMTDNALITIDTGNLYDPLEVSLSGPTRIAAGGDGTYTATPENFVGEPEYEWAHVRSQGRGEERVDVDGDTFELSFDQGRSEDEYEGRHVIAVEVTDEIGTATASIVVDVANDSPTARIDVSDPTPHVGETIELDGTISSDDIGVTSYEWSGAVSGSDRTVETSFGETGEYDVELTVTDTLGETASANTTIEVTNAPTADFTISNHTPEQYEEITFDATKSDDQDGEIVDYQWSGAFEGSGDFEQRSFEIPGQKEVTLTVTDDDGETHSKTSGFDVQESSSTGDGTAPAAPPNLTVTGTTPSSVTVDWDTPSDTGGSGIGEYRVTTDSGQRTTVSAGTTQATLSGLSENTTYKVDVEAVDRAGNVSGPATVVATTTSDGDTTAPNAPPNLSVAKTTTDSIAVDWNASSDTGGSGLDAYVVSVDGSRDQKVPAGTTAATISGLAADTNYTIGVTAVDTAGNESSTATVSGHTDQKDDGGGGEPPSNEAPIARVDLTFDKSGADGKPAVGATITFFDDGSSDPDGSIKSYDWSDGSSGTSTSVTVDSKRTVYSRTLTVTDDDGATDSYEAAIRSTSR